MTNTTGKESWEKEWKIFKHKWLELGYGLPDGCVNQIDLKVKSLISTLLTELEKDIKGLYKEITSDDDQAEFIFNDCLSQVLELINNLKKRE